MCKVEFMIESKMQMDVVPFLDILAETFTLTASLGQASTLSLCPSVF